jgi:hypothetical protein
MRHGDYLFQHCFQPVSQGFRNNFIDTPHETDGAKILDIHRLGLLGDEGDKSSIETHLKPPCGMKIMKNIHIFFKDLPTKLNKAKEKPSGPRALSWFKAFTTPHSPQKFVSSTYPPPYQ